MDCFSDSPSVDDASALQCACAAPCWPCKCRSAPSRQQRVTAFTAWLEDESNIKALHRVAYGRCGNPTISEDLVQQALEKTLRGIEHLPPPVACSLVCGSGLYFRGWVLRVLGNVAVDWWRREGKHQQMSRSLEASVDNGAVHRWSYSGTGLPVDDQTMAHVRDQQLRDAVQALPKQQRLCVLHVYFLDHSQAETGAALGISVNTVKTHMLRATLRLRAELGSDFENRF